MTDDLKTLAAIREILGSALREMETISISDRFKFKITEAEHHIAHSHGLVDSEIKLEQQEK